ncbi:MAG: putative DNA-binding transcriptional regulator YafY [Pseudohongiellaceae bacterium]|jgi:predicted DNA-binding transcriptional regulator YafY
MRRADRLFQIVQFLRTRRITTARWLAERLEVSERTIYRDVKDLMTSGVNIEGEAGIGYVVRKGFDLPPLMFTKEEIQALSFGARVVESWADTTLSTAAQSALSKIKSSLPDGSKDTLESTLIFSPFNRISPKISATMVEIRYAADNLRKVKIQYKRADGKVSDRIIWPLGLFFWGSVWTIAGWCEMREDFRSFRLDRVIGLCILNEVYPKEKGKSLQDLFESEKCTSY